MSFPLTLSYVAEGDLLHRVHFTQDVPLFTILSGLDDGSSSCYLSFGSRYGTITLSFSMGAKRRNTTRYMTNASLSWGKERVHVIDLPINGALSHAFLRDTMLSVIEDHLLLSKKS